MRVESGGWRVEGRGSKVEGLWGEVAGSRLMDQGVGFGFKEEPSAENEQLQTTDVCAERMCNTCATTQSIHIYTYVYICVYIYIYTYLCVCAYIDRKKDR